MIEKHFFCRCVTFDAIVPFESSMLVICCLYYYSTFVESKTKQIALCVFNIALEQSKCVHTQSPRCNSEKKGKRIAISSFLFSVFVVVQIENRMSITSNDNNNNKYSLYPLPIYKHFHVVAPPPFTTI